MGTVKLCGAVLAGTVRAVCGCGWGSLIVGGDKGYVYVVGRAREMDRV